MIYRINNATSKNRQKNHVCVCDNAFSPSVYAGRFPFSDESDLVDAPARPTSCHSPCSRLLAGSDLQAVYSEPR